MLLRRLTHSTVKISVTKVDDADSSASAPGDQQTFELELDVPAGVYLNSQEIMCMMGCVVLLLVLVHAYFVL